VANLGAACASVDSRWEEYPDVHDLVAVNRVFNRMTAPERIACAMQMFPQTQIMTSSFGAQSAVSLHMLTLAKPDIPVVLIDTGYLFPETYAFIETMFQRLDLNLHTYRSVKSPAWQEAQYGERWLQGVEGIEEYNQDNKVEPMQRALRELGVGTWYTGLRRAQSDSRADTAFVQRSGEYYKVAPLADWSDRDVYEYLQAHGLPYHPLWEEGYVSIGDVHTTRSLLEAGSEEETRFFGLKRECGLHDLL
jgi:phosphoadenosine phosphosulfate reductase